MPTLLHQKRQKKVETLWHLNYISFSTTTIKCHLYVFQSCWSHEALDRPTMPTVVRSLERLRRLRSSSDERDRKRRKSSTIRL